MAEEKKKSWFRTIWDKYSAFCKEMGVDEGAACRSCVPVVRFDEDKIEDKEKNSKINPNKV